MNSMKAIRSVKGGWLFVFRVLAVAVTVLLLGGCTTPVSKAPQLEAGKIGLERTSRDSFLTFQSVIGPGSTGQKIHVVVDTGAEVSGILGDRARGLTPTGAAVSVIGLHGGRLDGKVVRSPLRSPNGDNLFTDEQPVGAEMVVLPSGARLPGDTQALVGIDFLGTNAGYLDVGKAILAAKATVRGPQSGVRLDVFRCAVSSSELRFVACEYRGTVLVWLLDTGASQTLLSRSTAEKIGVSGIGMVSHLIDSGGHRVALRHSALRNTRWGKANHGLKSLPVGITELPHLRDFRLADGSPVDGVLGIDMLTRQAAVIDFRSDVMWLNPAS